MVWTKLNTSGREESVLELLLRIGVAGCFIGHGAFGLIGKQAWLPYFAVAGISEEWAWALMPAVGALDVLVGILVLLAPRPAFLGYAAVWSVWTALLRPLSGESFFETLERAGNYGVPIVFLILVGVGLRPTTDWLRVVQVGPLSRERRRLVMLTLRVTIATLLVGHGGLALLAKPLLASHVSVLGLPAGSLVVVGVLDLVLAVGVLFRPTGFLLMGIVIWKVSTEALYPLSGAPFWEFVERAGSYIAPLALWTMVGARSRVVLANQARTVVSVVLLAGVGMALGGAPLWVSPTAPPTVPSLREASLLELLRSGGYVFACRHSITDRSRGDSRPIDFGDRSTQRVLSADGQRQARRFGEVLRRQEIPIGEVLTSPYWRAAESARLAFGRAQELDVLYRRDSQAKRELARLLRQEPAEGKNRVLMSHQWALYPVMPTVERGSIREGDCVVVNPSGDSFEVVARLGPDEWEALTLEEEGETLSEVDRGIAAARVGGGTLVCRHAITNSYQEREPVNYADSTTQRLLNSRGERQSRRVGRAMTELGVVVTDLVASPMNRARRTAALMFDRPPRIDSVWHTNGGSYEGVARRARQRTLGSTVEGGSRLIVSHIGTMSSVLKGLDGRVSEGDCVVVRPESDGHVIVGVVPWRAWIEVAAGQIVT